MKITGPRKMILLQNGEFPKPETPKVLFSMALFDHQLEVRTRVPHVTIMVKKQWE
jgi:hypothetical protein